MDLAIFKNRKQQAERTVAEKTMGLFIRDNLSGTTSYAVHARQVDTVLDEPLLEVLVVRQVPNTIEFSYFLVEGGNSQKCARESYERVVADLARYTTGDNPFAHVKPGATQALADAKQVVLTADPTFDWFDDGNAV